MTHHMASFVHLEESIITSTSTNTNQRTGFLSFDCEISFFSLVEFFGEDCIELEEPLFVTCINAEEGKDE